MLRWRVALLKPKGKKFLDAQTLLILLRKTPPSPCRLLIISTTSIASYLEDLQLTQSFNVLLHVTMLQTPSEIEAVIHQYAAELSSANIANLARTINKPIGVKQLLMVLEMARSEGLSSISPEHFMECLHTMGF